eukprot:jgi/Picsp_1/6710/NSC_04052-R1_dna-apurinic or apyrimidinic site lyase 2
MASNKKLRILSWNVNGLKACLKRLYGRKSSISEFLNGDIGKDYDIVCIQETKLTKSELLQSNELTQADGWLCFYSVRLSESTAAQKGYSGTATFVRRDACVPFEAELGFTQGWQKADEEEAGMMMVASSSCESHQRWLDFGFSMQELRVIDGEGRVVVTDHKDFVLFNIYGPAITSEDPERAKLRMDFKMKFFCALEMSWKEILEKKGVPVIVVGDFNIAPRPTDYPDVDFNFFREDRPDRMWMKKLLQGGFSDCFRVFHPDRKNAFTVWSQATGARQNNYGSRIDLCLSSGLSFSGKEGNGPCHVSGCDIHPLVMGSDHCPVSLDIEYSHDYAFPCSNHIPETEISCIIGKKQMKISFFLGKRLAHQLEGDYGKGDYGEGDKGDYEHATMTTSKSEDLQGNTKRQATLKDMLNKKSSENNAGPESQCPSNTCTSLLLEKELAAAEEMMATNRARAKNAWGKIHDKMKIPNCRHGITAALKRVSKQGPNQGRYFYSCSLPKGHGPEGQCGFFQWVTSKTKT